MGLSISVLLAQHEKVFAVDIVPSTLYNAPVTISSYYSALVIAVIEIQMCSPREGDRLR